MRLINNKRTQIINWQIENLVLINLIQISELDFIFRTILS